MARRRPRGGAGVARARSPPGWPRWVWSGVRRDLATQQASASVGQGLLLARYAESFGRRGLTVGQVLLTAEDVVRRTHYANARRTLDRLLGLGVVPVVNENDTVATHEIRFGDNDRLAALVAHLVGADALVLLSDVDALYDRPPNRPAAQRIPLVRGPGAAGRGADRLDGFSRCRHRWHGHQGGRRRDRDDGRDPDTADLRRRWPVRGWRGRTWVPGSPRAGDATRSRLLWLAHAARAAGRLVLDDGAVAAVVDRRMSLLPAGVTRVEGRFSAGDPVDLLDPRGKVVARGLVNYDAKELPALLGRSTRDLARELGAAYQREVVHRDDLVLIRGRQGACLTRVTI